jgi:hypothetical protein
MLDMNRQHGTLPVKERIVRALRRARDPVEAVANAVSDTILGSVKAEDPLASAFVSVTDIIRSAVDGAVEAGADLAQAAKGISIGILRGTRETGEPAQKSLGHAARAIVFHAAKIGGDLGAAARGVVQGSIHGARAMGLDAAAAARAAGHSILDAGEDIGSEAARQLRRGLDAATAKAKDRN